MLPGVKCDIQIYYYVLKLKCQNMASGEFQRFK